MICKDCSNPLPFLLQRMMDLFLSSFSKMIEHRKLTVSKKRKRKNAVVIGIERESRVAIAIVVVVARGVR